MTNIPKNAKLVSFDIVNMYTNIPISDTLKIIKYELIKNKIHVDKIAEILKLLQIITEQNYFKHKDKFYTQNDGLAMGSPLSGTLANIYINHFERTYVNNENNKFKNNIIYWHRYVDDILLLFNGTERQLDNMHKYINNIHPNISFTLEREKEKQINFLDLTITNHNQQHKFQIYRKPTQTNHTIHSSSHHPLEHKISAYSHMLHRLNNIPMNDEDYKKELKIITEIAISNGYSKNLITNINKKIKNKINQYSLTTLYIKQPENKKYISLPYNEFFTNLSKPIFKKYGYTLAHRTNNTIMQKTKIKNTTTENDCGVYKLICNDCPKFYIGQTGRTFNQRFNEHIAEINTTNPKSHIKSNYAQHIKKENHTYTDIDTNLQILHYKNKGKILDRIEEYEIYKERKNPNIMNDKTNTKANKIYDFIQELKSTN